MKNTVQVLSSLKSKWYQNITPEKLPINTKNLKFQDLKGKLERTPLVEGFEKGGLQRSLEHISKLAKTKNDLAKKITDLTETIATLPDAVQKKFNIKDFLQKLGRNI